jgi:RimJ/RimL family protein N-acetyltransferase
MSQPVLRTDRLLLIPLTNRHLELEVRLDSDPEVLRYIEGRARSRDEVVVSHARRMALATKVDGLGYWMTFGSDGGRRGSQAPVREEGAEFIGLMMLPPANGADQPDDPTVAELGYRLARPYWRQGLAAEASLTLLRHAFDVIGQRRVIAQTMATNVGSQGVMKAVGMRYTRTYFPVWESPIPGADHGEVEYEMTREMWLARV